jgi:hypothetical protein
VFAENIRHNAIFQLIDAVRLRTLPVKDPNRPPQPEPLGQWQSQQSLFRFHFSFMAADSPATEPFSSIAVWGPARLNLATGGEVRNANAICVSGDFFRALHPRRSHGGVAIRVVLRASRDHAEISPSHDEQTMSNRTLPSAYLNDPRPDINSSQPPKPPYNNRVCVAWHPSRRSRFSSPFPSGHSVAEVTPAVAGMPAVSAVDIPVSAVDTAAAALAEAM